MDEPFFILGFGRSGTTLLASMLSMIPGVYIPPELRGLYDLDWRLRYFGDLSTPYNLQLLAREIESLHQMKRFGLKMDSRRFLEKLGTREKNLGSIVTCFYETLAESQGKRRIGDKTILHSVKVATIRRLFPEAKIIHVVRDGRDCAVSHKKISPDYNVYLSASRWLEYNTLLAECGRRDPANYFMLKYEDFVARPQPLLERLCVFLGEEYQQGMMDYARGDYAAENVKFIGKQHALLQHGVRSDNTGKWRSALTPQEVAIFQSVAADKLREFGYGLAEPSPGVGWRLAKLKFVVGHRRDELGEVGLRARFMLFMTAKRVLRPPLK